MSSALFRCDIYRPLPMSQAAGLPRLGVGVCQLNRDGKVLTTLALDILDGQIQAIRSVVNPDKLGHVGPVADAWAVARELNQARDPTD